MKVKLIKSFAGYPVWEYLNTWEYYIMWVKPQLEDGKLYRIHKDIVEWMKQNFEETKERPTSWEEIWKIDWYYTERNSDIKKPNILCSISEDNKNIFKTKDQCEASIALAQITQLLDKYDIPEESKKWYSKNWPVVSWSYYLSRNELLQFDTVEKFEHFYKHHTDLIKKLEAFYIF